MVSKCNGSYLYQSHQPLLVRNISESVYYHPKLKFLCNYIHNFLKSTLYQMYAIWRRNKVIYDQTMQILTQRFLSVSVAQSRPTLCDPMDCSPPGSSVHGILQTRILEWVAIFFSRRSSQPRDRTYVSCTGGGFFSTELPKSGSEK